MNNSQLQVKVWIDTPGYTPLTSAAGCGVDVDRAPQPTSHQELCDPMMETLIKNSVFHNMAILLEREDGQRFGFGSDFLSKWRWCKFANLGGLFLSPWIFLIS